VRDEPSCTTPSWCVLLLVMTKEQQALDSLCCSCPGEWTHNTDPLATHLTLEGGSRRTASTEYSLCCPIRELQHRCFGVGGGDAEIKMGVVVRMTYEKYSLHNQSHVMSLAGYTLPPKDNNKSPRPGLDPPPMCMQTPSIVWRTHLVRQAPT
jgi:hypothetical protein